MTAHKSSAYLSPFSGKEMLFTPLLFICGLFNAAVSCSGYVDMGLLKGT
jgi:hypothetical protein